MKTLIIVNGTLTQNGWVYDGVVVNDDNAAAFNALQEVACTSTLIAEHNYNDIVCGYCIFDTIDYDNTTSFAYTMMRYYGFRKCDECGTFIPPQDVRNNNSIWDGSKRLCAKCASAQAQRKKKIALHRYHSTSNQVRVINGEGENYNVDDVMGIGIEFEINSHNNIVRNNEIECTDEFYAQANSHSHNRIWRVEQDCTVAVELISNIFTEKALRAYDFNTLTQQALKLHNDESIRNVGLHVHLTKTWMGLTESEQVLNFLKLQYFLKSYEKDFLKISGRKESEMGYCGFYSLSEIEQMRAYITRGNGWGSFTSGHDKGLINSCKTIEWRLFKSTNDAKRIVMWLELVLGITKNIKNVPFEKCYCLNKVLKQVPANVLDYWRKQGAFLSTNAITTRGEASI